jgi:hypothetical protein
MDRGIAWRARGGEVAHPAAAAIRLGETSPRALSRSDSSATAPAAQYRIATTRDLCNTGGACNAALIAGLVAPG